MIEQLESRMLCSASTPIDGGAAQPAAASTAQLLPDLIPWANKRREYIYGWHFDTSEKPGHLLLRLTTAIANIGTGPLELRGGARTSTGGQNVYQRIYNNDGTAPGKLDGTYSDHLAGVFTYHPAHHHTHFDDFSSYRLRTALPNGGVGKIVGSGTKTSFCLTDVEAWPKPLPNASSDGDYFVCDAKMQGISVGFADVYHWSLADQWIDITNVKPGKYWLEVVADPRNHIAESNEKNNTARVLVNLRDIQPPKNDSFANRIVLSGRSVSTSGHNTQATVEEGEPDHSDHAPGASVWWSWTAPASGRVAISTAGSSFDTVLGVYTGNSVDSLTKVARNDDDGDLRTSKVTFNAIEGTTYQISVDGYVAATGRIRLSINM